MCNPISSWIGSCISISCAHCGQ